GAFAIALAFDSLFNHAHGFVMEFGGIEYPSLTDLDFGQVPTESYGLPGSVPCSLDPRLIAAVIAVEHGAGVGAGGVGEGKVGVHGHRVFEHLQGELETLTGLAARVALAAQVKVIGLQVFRGLDG